MRSPLAASSAQPKTVLVRSLPRASRLFLSRDRFTPSDFAAYGIVAFRSAATSSSAERYRKICEGFVASLDATDTLTQEWNIPLSEQMTTVWPLDDVRLADDLNFDERRDEVLKRCPDIVAHISTTISGAAIASARIARGDRTIGGVGPYLLAWSPSDTFGSADARVLVVDLSNVTSVDQATSVFVDWANDIEGDPALWRDGWRVRDVRRVLGQWFDKYGDTIIMFLGLSDD